MRSRGRKSERKKDEWQSAIYEGFVRHRRLTPKRHEFKYPIFMVLLKIDEIPNIMQRFWQLSHRRLSWGRFKREDYIGDPNQSISKSVKQEISKQLGRPDDADTLVGDVYFMGHLRYLGLYFSPLNLYFFKQDGHFRYMLAEVSNTPWNERHYYLIDLENIQPHDKDFHVSPFNPMAQTYHWRIVPPDSHKTKAMIHLESHSTIADSPLNKTNASQKVFDATLVLKRRALNQTELNRVLTRTPIQTASIVLGIYWQALKLFIKGVPFYGHPGKTKTETNKGMA